MLMPTQSSEFVGIKVLTLAPGNPALGKATIQAVYLLMDAITLSPVAVIDGTALTTLRTPATSAAVADHLAPDQIEHLVVFGSGPQAWGHVEAMRAIRSISRVTIVDIDPERATALVTRVGASGLHARVGSADDVRDAQLIVCATTARTPLFDGNLVRDDSLTVAVGAYEPDARELDSELIRRAQLVVDDVSTALREAGDVIIPIAEGVIESASLIPMRDIIMGATLVDHQRPRVFKSTGMSWEDLVVASEVFRASGTGRLRVGSTR
jgi:ornithine cyclodeaminase